MDTSRSKLAVLQLNADQFKAETLPFLGNLEITVTVSPNSSKSATRNNTNSTVQYYNIAMQLDPHSTPDEILRFEYSMYQTQGTHLYHSTLRTKTASSLTCYLAQTTLSFHIPLAQQSVTRWTFRPSLNMT